MADFEFDKTGFVALRGDFQASGVSSTLGNYYGGNYTGGSILVRSDGVVLATYSRSTTRNSSILGGDIMVSHVASEEVMRTNHNSAAANEFRLTTMPSSQVLYKSRLLKLDNGDFLLFVYRRDPVAPSTSIERWRCTNGDGTHAGDWTNEGTMASTPQGNFDVQNYGLGVPLQMGGGRITVPVLYPYKKLHAISFFPVLVVGPDTSFNDQGISGLAMLISDDNGASWSMSRIWPGPDDLEPDNITLNFDVHDPNGNVVFGLDCFKGTAIFSNGYYVGVWQDKLDTGAISSGHGGQPAVLFRSDNFGDTWRKVTAYEGRYPSVDNNHLGMLSYRDGWNYLVRGHNFSSTPGDNPYELTVYRAPNSAALPNDESWITDVASSTRIPGDSGTELIQTPGIMTVSEPTASGVSMQEWVDHGYRWITYQAVNGSAMLTPNLGEAKSAGFADGWGVGVWGVVYSQGDFFDFGMRLGSQALRLGAGHVIVDAEFCLKGTLGGGAKPIIDGLRAGGWSGPVHLSTLGGPSNPKTASNPGGNDFAMDVKSFLDTGGGVLPQAYSNDSRDYDANKVRPYWNYVGVSDAELNFTIGLYSAAWRGSNYVPLLTGAGVKNNFSIFLAENTTQDDLTALDVFTNSTIFISNPGAFWTWIGGPMGDDGNEYIYVSDQSGYIYFMGTSTFSAGNLVYLNGAPGNGGPGSGDNGRGIHFVGQF